jgi:hypothetical protein
MDLLAWQAPEVVRSFAPELVRGVTFEARLSRAVSLATRRTRPDRGCKRRVHARA